MTPESSAEPHPEAVVRKRKGIQTVWIIPIVAALVGGWLWYRALQEQGPIITITFKTAEGLEAGKTRIKYKDLEVGKVSDISLEPGLEFVRVTAEMAPGAKEYMLDKTSFWVVKPRIGAGGVSGLSTIVSGSYIAMDIPKSGTPTMTFTGLEEPPSRPVDAEGLHIMLQSETLGSINRGTAVYHRQIKMGDVDSYTYDRERELIEFEVYIEPEYADLVRKNTRFWTASGFDVHLSSDGFDIHAESLEAMLAGGIAFGAAPGEAPGAPATNGDTFTLLPSRAKAEEINTDPRRTIAYFHEPIGGLSVGAAVEFQGIEIGKVVEMEVIFDPETAAFRMPVVVETYPNRLINQATVDPDEPYEERLQRLVDLGLRAQLGPANILTGARSIVVLLKPDSPANYFGSERDLPEIPTIPSTGEAIMEMIEQLPVIVADLRTTVNGVSDIVTSQGTKETLESVQHAAASVEAVLAQVQDDSGPMLASIQATADDVQTLVDSVNQLVETVGADAPELMASITGAASSAQDLMQSGEAGMPVVQQELVMALRNVAAGMRSLADLADYLERHPDALLMGKTTSGGQ